MYSSRFSVVRLPVKHSFEKSKFICVGCVNVPKAGVHFCLTVFSLVVVSYLNSCEVSLAWITFKGNWVEKKERSLFQSCFDIMTTLIQLFLQTINRTEECRSEIFALNGETSLNKKLASSLHRRQMNAFFFLPFPTKTNPCFYVLCKWFRHVVWQFYFCYFFFSTKGKTQRKNTGLTFHLEEHSNSEFSWRCS